MSSWPGYREWYRRNKKSLSKKRKAKYKNNKTYREDQKKRANAYYHNVKKSLLRHADRYTLETKDGEKFVTIGRVAKLINRHVQIVREYHRAGIIPEPLYYDSRGWRLYSAPQVELLKDAFYALDRHKGLNLREISEEIKERWKK